MDNLIPSPCGFLIGIIIFLLILLVSIIYNANKKKKELPDSIVTKNQNPVDYPM